MSNVVSTVAEGRAGFTLVEVLIASSIMLVGIFGVLAAFVQAFDGTKTAGRVGVLNQLAVEKLEQVLALDYADSDLSSGTHPTQVTHPDGDKYYPVAGYPSQYSVRWTVSAGPTRAAGTAEPNMKTVVVEAAYLVRYQTSGTPILSDHSTTVVLRTFLAQ